MTEPENDRPESTGLPDSETEEPAINESPQSETEQPERAQSPQRLRAILAGLVTVAILAVLAIAIFDDGSDDGQNNNQPAQTIVSDTSGDNGEQEVVGGEELGSLAVTGYLCPAGSSPESACLDAGTAEIQRATLLLADGRRFTLEGVQRQEDGSYAWLNIPIGEYVLLAEGLLGPSGTLARDVIGAEGQTAEGWQISNLDPNQPAIIQILFNPEGEGTAAG